MSYFRCNYFKLVNKQIHFSEKSSTARKLSFSHVSENFDSKKIKSKLIR